MSGKNRLVIKFNTDNLALIAFVIFFCNDCFKSMAIRMFSIVGYGGLGIVFVNLLTYSFLLLPFLKRCRRLWDCLLLYTFFICLFGITYLWFPNYRFYLTRPTFGFSSRVLRLDRAIYAYLMIRCVNTPKEIWKGLKYVACIEFLYCTYQFLDFLRVGYWVDYNSLGELAHYTYNLTYGYSVTFPIVIFLTWAVKEKNKKLYIPTVILLFCMLMAGSRGTIIVIVVFIALLMYSYTTLINLLKYFIIIIMGGIVIALTGFENIIMYIASIGEKMGISSRTLLKLVSGTISDGTGRDLIYEAALGIIKDHKLFGTGLFGDRPVIVQYHNAGYCHNIFLELASNFGIPVAILVLGMILLWGYRIMVRNKDIEWKLLFAIFFSVSCQLLLSMSYWFVPSFWAMLGIFVNYSKDNKSYSRKKKVKNQRRDKNGK